MIEREGGVFLQLHIGHVLDFVGILQGINRIVESQRVVARAAIQGGEQHRVFLCGDIRQFEQVIARTGGERGFSLAAVLQGYRVIAAQQIDGAGQVTVSLVGKVHRLLIHIHHQRISGRRGNGAAVHKVRGVAIVDIHHLGGGCRCQQTRLFNVRRLPADDQRRAAAGIINIDADAGFNIPGGIGGHPAPFGAVDVHHQGLGLRHIVGVVGHRAVGILEQQTGTAADDVYHAAVALRQRSRSTDSRAVMGVDCRVIQMDTGNFSLVFNAVAGTNRIHVDGGIFDRKSCSAVIQQDTVSRSGSMGNAATGQIERRAIRQSECGPTIGCGNHPGVVDRRIRAENIDGGTIHANRRGIIQRPAVDQYTRAVRRQIDSPAVVQRTAGQYLVAQGPDGDVIPVQYRGAVQNGCAGSAFFAGDRRRAATDDPCRRAVLRKANIGTGVNCRFRAAFHA